MSVPDEGYYVPDEGYYVPDEGYYVPDEGYSRNASCTLNLISTFLLCMYLINFITYLLKRNILNYVRMLYGIHYICQLIVIRIYEIFLF